MAPKQPPRSNETQDFGIGAPAAPPEKAPVFHLKPTKQQAAAAAAAKAAAKAQKDLLRQNDIIFAKRQEVATKAAIAQRAAATAGLTPTGSPFAGVEKGKGAPAKPFQGSEETTKTQLAKARGQRLNQGGLLSPQQHLAEALALLDTSRSRALTFGDTHQLPTSLSQPSRHIPPPAPRVDLGAPAAPPENPTTSFAAGRGRSVTGPRPSGGGFDLGKILGAISTGAGTALETAASVPGTMLSPIRASGMGIGADTSVAHVKPTSFPQASQDVSSRFNAFTEQAASALRSKPPPLPHVPIPHNFLNDSAKAASKGQKVYLDDLTDSQKYGDYALGAAGRAYFVKLAGQNGYNEKDAPTWNDADLAARALGPHNEVTFTGLLRNLAADVGQQASLASAVPMIGNAAIQSIAQGSPAPALRLAGQYAQGIQRLLPFVGDRPWGENLYERPVSTYLAVAPGAKALSREVGRGMRLKPERSVELPTRKAAVDAGVLPPGSERITIPASQHPLARLGEAAHDRLLAQATHPAERAAAERARTSARHPAAELAHLAGRAPERIGNKLEERMTRRHIDALHMKARLTAGHEPALALDALFKSYRQLPMMRTLLESWKKDGGKEAEFEAVIKHHGAASSGDQLAESYRAHAQNSLERAAELQIDAELAPNKATADRYRAGADELVADSKRQMGEASYSEAAAIDIHAPKSKVQRSSSSRA